MIAKYKQRGVLSPVMDGTVPIPEGGVFPTAYEAWYEDEKGNRGPKGYFLAGGTGERVGPFFFGHDMIDIADQSTDKVAEALYRKNELLYDFDWFHPESWKNILEHLPKLIAANEQAKHYFVVGVKHGGAAGMVTAVVELMIGSEYAFRFLDGFVIVTYMQSPGYAAQAFIEEVQAVATKHNIKLYIFKNGFSPSVAPGADEVGGLITDEMKYPDFGVSSSVQSAEMVSWELDNYPYTCIVPFPSENTTGESLLATNKILLEGSNARKKPSCVADFAEYASDTGKARLTFADRKANYDYILSLPLNERPWLVLSNTDNDPVESSDMSRLPNRGPLPGLGSVIKWPAQYLDNNPKVRHPMPEHDGCGIAFNPYKMALKQGLSKPVVNDYKIFYSFIAHPGDVQPMTEIPPMLAAEDPAYAGVFKDSMYVRTFEQQPESVRQAMLNYTNKIDVLVWSPKDCQIECNGKKSPVLKAGVCTWSFEKDGYGSVVLAIIVNGRSVLKTVSDRPIINYPWPDWFRTGYGYSKPNDTGTIQSAPVWKKTKNGLELTGSGELMVYVPGGRPKPYDGPYKGNYPAGAFIGYKAANDTYNAGPVALSPAL